MLKLMVSIYIIYERFNSHKIPSKAFETFMRSSDISIQTFLNEFEKRLHKTKSYGTEMSEDILAYRLLKSVNLSNEYEQLIKATFPELQYGSRC